MCTCQQCGKQWTWTESMKTIFRFRKGMKCTHCGEVQYQSKASRDTTALLYLLPILIVPIGTLLQLSAATAIVIEMILLVVVLLLSPRFLVLTNEEQPFW